MNSLPPRTGNLLRTCTSSQWDPQNEGRSGTRGGIDGGCTGYATHAGTSGSRGCRMSGVQGGRCRGLIIPPRLGCDSKPRVAAPFDSLVCFSTCQSKLYTETNYTDIPPRVS
ncbi:hypothetical protein BaRGS_00013683 [Batillaria attramentaria]|uniref:Uncharacterized protein n=1 Tax=Batillaria attramentaria TaxID=370345 RepID=A0ABD0L6S8_9CAEN